MDKDAQLDEIERLAGLKYQSGLYINMSMFQPGGLYYEMRRENEDLREKLHQMKSQRK